LKRERKKIKNQNPFPPTYSPTKVGLASTKMEPIERESVNNDRLRFLGLLIMMATFTE
jgi:hypothetical protein